LVSFYEPWKSYPRPDYPNGPANKPIGFDSLRIFYPLRSLTIDSFRHFQLPLWNPYDFAGNTQLATYQSAVFFPLTPLFFLLPQIDAWSLIVFLEPFLASWFMYLFLRSLSLSKKSSVLGALAFGFSGGILVLSEESFMSVYSLFVLPLILLGLYKFYENGKFKWFALFTLSLVSSILSGWFQSTLYVLLLSFVWLLFLSLRKKSLAYFLLTSFGFVTSFLIAAVHFVPNIESYLYSARGTTDAKFLFDTYLVPPWHLITYIAPDFFGNPGTYNYFDNGFYYEKIVTIGVVGLFLGLIALFRLRKTPEEWFFTISWIVTVSLGLSIPMSWFILYTLHIPLISTILPSRIFLLSAFCLSVMSAFGSENLFKKPNKLAFFFSTFTIITVLVIVWNFLTQQKMVFPLGNFAAISYRNMLLPTGLMGATIIGCFILLFSKRFFKWFGFGILLLISIVSIVYFSNKYLYFSERQFTFPQIPVLTKLNEMIGNNRFWSFGEGYMERNFATYYRVESPEGYDSFYIRTYGEFIAASQNGGKLTTNIPRADVQLTSVSRLSEIANNPSLIKSLNLLGVKYIFAKKSQEDDMFLQNASNSLFAPVWTDNTYVIYQNVSAFPRAFLVDSYRVITNPSKQLSVLFDSAMDASKTIIVNKDPKIKQTDNILYGSARITSYTSEQITIKTTSNKQALLFLSDNMYPGWIATVDNKKTDIFTADHTFRSVVVPSGQHTIIFSYQPRSVLLGFVLSGVGVLLFVCAGFTIKKKIKK
ncbi:MAG TPA: YfhO family protein, partial [Patescibacteria group bacterium]|nr:YfhO family protein [Patescibacteria group bacterium]